MDVIELIERRKFKQLYKNVKRKKLDNFFFCIYRYNNLYKGKNEYLLKIWKGIINKPKYANVYNDMSIVNFKYVCDFFTYELNTKKSYEKHEYPNDVCANELSEKKNIYIAKVFLKQLIDIIKYQANKLNEILKDDKNSKEYNDNNNENRIKNKDTNCSEEIEEIWWNHNNLIVMNENREFDFLFNITHTLIYNSYITNIVVDMLKISYININECFLKYILYTIYNVYMKNKDILFFYFIIYKKLKKIKNNIINSQSLLIYWNIVKYIRKKKNILKVIQSFKILRHFFLNICDKNLICNFVKYIFDCLQNRLIILYGANWQNECIFLQKKTNIADEIYNDFSEFSFFVYLSIRDLNSNDKSLFNFNLKQIKNIAKADQIDSLNIYMILNYINNSNLDNCSKLKYSTCIVLKNLSPNGLAMKNENLVFFSHFEKLIKSEMNKNIEIKNNNDITKVTPNNFSEGAENNLNFRQKFSECIHNVLKSSNSLICDEIKRENFISFQSVLKYIYIIFYNTLNKKGNPLINRFDNKNENYEIEENMKYIYNYAYFSDAKYSNFEFLNKQENKNSYVILISLLLHMNIISIDDIWNIKLLNNIKNNYFFNILNFFKLKKKYTLFFLTISRVLKVNPQLIVTFSKCENVQMFGDINQNEEINFLNNFYGNIQSNNENNLYFEIIVNEKYIKNILKKQQHICDYSNNEKKLIDTITFLLISSLTKYIYKLPLNISKYILKEILKYLSKPLHDVKKRINEYFDNMCLRIIFYIFELIYIISCHIYYSNDIKKLENYNKEFYIFSFFFNLIDVYIKFIEKYNKKNNTCIYSFLNYKFCQFFLLFFDFKMCNKYVKYSDTIPNYTPNKFTDLHSFPFSTLSPYLYSSMENSTNRELKEIGIQTNSLVYIEDVTLFSEYYNKYIELQKSKKNLNYIDENDDKNNFDEIYTSYIISVLFIFIKNNNPQIMCYLYTLLLYAISNVHTSVSYRYRELNYLIFLHILPWKQSLNYSIMDSKLSSFFFQKFYECVQNLLPEIVVENFSPFPDLEKERKKNSKTYFEMNYESDETQNSLLDNICEDNQNVKNNLKNEYTNNFNKKNIVSKINLNKMTIYEQVIKINKAVINIFFSNNDTEKMIDDLIILHTSNNLLRNSILITNFINIIFLKKEIKEKNVFEVLQNIFDEQVTSYYISIFQNPLNFFLTCSKKFCEILIRYNFMDNLIFFIFTKLNNYLSLIPPKLFQDDYLPLNVEDIISLQETSMAQFIINIDPEITNDYLEYSKECSLFNSKQTNSRNENTGVALELKKKKYFFSDLTYFLRKMNIITSTLNVTTLNGLYESGFNSKSAFYLSFYINEHNFTNIFYYLNNNIMAITNENFNLEDNINYYEHIHIKNTTFTLNPYNILDKTVFYFQIVIFYLIINANNKLIDTSKYTETICTYFINCLELHSKPYVSQFIISIIQILIQYFYFFPSLIPNILPSITKPNNYQKELSNHLVNFQKKITRILEISYKYGSDKKES
ncbi:conserved Plasmodium protein, unknown function [Plasmodium berghei]|uniref:Uncharacterized protein n=2 Tax=Plasmodium berghei TaxID=5821 RepID=A0A509ATH0_PLABA|nr:conserved Plasmodium protein, unknown function [Plasmodium berghei ANKA]CXJ23654.1 conserved Plasmodium protein, unknown function [Plasmodium berghei]SCN28616.1 conserved Plasmodium protein, unknown function [Plasmodium berghei]SCO62810.1 conserved Plasmodium protein, unknown function [Plasmodium berghei]SCO64364.1 conserved Plasmodium protein, unknown function [Plasmodium berghei]VUC58497.1 conserved Plasmodium protein, unknown function [Plasmodium berghei ANKA]|eukprot:XP_034424260.1 conserved Plasmodium protein, unknown function [Plasmodium berghei ANKA]